MIIYTDGSCLGNGKAVNTGGFGVIVLDKDENLLYNYKKRSENTTKKMLRIRLLLQEILVENLDGQPYRDGTHHHYRHQDKKEVS